MRTPELSTVLPSETEPFQHAPATGANRSPFLARKSRNNGVLDLIWPPPPVSRRETRETWRQFIMRLS